MPTRAQMQVCHLLVMHDLAELTCRCVACMPPTCDTLEATAPLLSQAQMQVYQGSIDLAVVDCGLWPKQAQPVMGIS